MTLTNSLREFIVLKDLCTFAFHTHVRAKHMLFILSENRSQTTCQTCFMLQNLDHMIHIAQVMLVEKY